MINIRFVRLTCMVLAVSLLGTFSLFAGGAQEEEPEVPPEVEERTGGWFDEIVTIEEDDSSAAIARLEAGELDMYAHGLSEAELYDRILANEDLGYEESYGGYNELTFNTAGPEFADADGFNPFAVPEIREAMNYLIDREHIADEIYGGLARPRYLPISTALPDYARLSGISRALELEYSYDPGLAEEIISSEMRDLGATMQDGVWHYDGEPVELIILIRNEDERLDIGDYIANQLEDIGFETERIYASAAEAGPLWTERHPDTGEFHVYTGGWITTAVVRDQADNFDFFYTPRGLPFPLWQNYEPTEEFDQIADDLASRRFDTMEERADMFAEALRLSMEDSSRIWLVDTQDVTARRADLSVAADLAGGVSGASLWALTMRDETQVGGTANLGLPSILTEPWNPIDGSNWVYDQMMIEATSEDGVQPDPFTGLYWPHRIESADVLVREDLPVETTHDWVNLERTGEIDVPEDAWADWNAAEQRFVTVGEEEPDGVTARTMVRVQYPDDLYDTVQWHDGSSFSIGDVLLYMILAFDRAQEESPYFDQAAVPTYESFMDDFRGVRIVSEDPLVIETYTDSFYLDAEVNVFNVGTWWPMYAQGTGAWHNLGLALKAEGNEQMALSSDKADRLEVEWTSLVAGPTIELLEENLETAQADGFLPFADFMSDYVDSAEISSRWSNLAAWYDEYEHFWVGTGPYQLAGVFPVEGTVQLTRFEDYPDLATRWDQFEEPMIADATVDGPVSVDQGQEAEYDIHITFAGQPYAIEDIQEVTYLLFDARGDLVHEGIAEPAEDGRYTATLESDVTAALPDGSARLEVAVSSRMVAIPTFTGLEFIVGN